MHLFMIIMLFIPNKSKIDILYLVPSLCGVQLITSFHPDPTFTAPPIGLSIGLLLINYIIIIRLTKIKALFLIDKHWNKVLVRQKLKKESAIVGPLNSLVLFVLLPSENSHNKHTPIQNNTQTAKTYTKFINEKKLRKN